jgi:hypothetical protein
MASTYLTKTFTASNRKTFTISFWVKRSRLTLNQCPFGAGTNHSTDRDFFAFLADSGEEDKLYFNSKVSNSTVAQFYTSRRFRDTNAWYHIVLAFDTTQATDSDRMKLYVNGEQETYQSVTYPSQNQDMNYNNTVHTVGSSISPSDYLDGCMSHFHFIDGTQYAASTFGSTDATTGEWRINTSPSVTYGTNGFFILKDANGVTDQSGNSNNFTVGGGTLTTLQDNPSNVFCTISPLDNMSANNTTVHDGKLINVNTAFSTSDANQIYTRGTIGVKSGKYYWEAQQGNGTAWAIGIMVEAMLTQTNNQFWDTTTITGVAVNGSSGNLYINGGQSDSWNTGISVSASTIYGFALDVDNKGFYVHVNGTYLTANSAVGDPTSGSSRTGSVLGELTTRGGTGGLLYIPDDEYIYPFQGDLSSSNYSELKMNFGNGYFGTTAISSEGTNASGIGKFEYDVPTGYTALSTKGLNL